MWVLVVWQQALQRIIKVPRLEPHCWKASMPGEVSVQWDTSESLAHAQRVLCSLSGGYWCRGGCTTNQCRKEKCTGAIIRDGVYRFTKSLDDAGSDSDIAAMDLMTRPTNANHRSKKEVGLWVHIPIHLFLFTTKFIRLRVMTCDTLYFKVQDIFKYDFYKHGRHDHTVLSEISSEALSSFAQVDLR